ncbi:MAG: ZrgA family zinc uptake protein [Endozoicomonas sp.]
MRYSSKMIIAISAMFSSAVMANHHEESRHADAHIHGAGHLNFAVEGKEIHLELEIPGFDILGFESVTTDTQRELIHDAIHDLKEGDLWKFSSAAGCKLVSASANLAGEEDHGENHHNHDHELTHMDFGATYVYECEKPGKLKVMSTNLFTRFENSETLKVQSFTDTGQTAAIMTRAQPEVRF